MKFLIGFYKKSFLLADHIMCGIEEVYRVFYLVLIGNL